MEKVFIYVLVDSSKNEIRYVGKTVNPHRRFKRHISERYLRDTYKDRWIINMIDSGYYPEMEIIDEVSESEWEYWEKFYIQYLKYIGCNLTNTTNGGDQPPSTKGRKHKLESRLKMSETKKGKPIPWLNNGEERSQNHKDNLSKSLRGRKSPNKGKKFDDDYRKKLSNASTSKIKVKQLDIDGNLIKVWDSISEAQKTLQIRHISDVCRNKRHHKTSGGFKWEYLNET
jgi:group I intron endonuclease